MSNRKPTEIQKKNWKMINELMDIRAKQFQEIYEYRWWENLIEDELYKFYCQKIIEIKMSLSPTYILNKKITDEEIKLLSTKIVSVDEFMKSVEGE